MRDPVRADGRAVRLQGDDRGGGRGLHVHRVLRRVLPRVGRAVLDPGDPRRHVPGRSRSYYGKIIPKDHANEYYGFYDIFGKTASILGTFLVATTTSITGNASLGVLSIAILLVLALIFLLLQKDPTRD